MLRSLWTAASGMIAQQTNVDNIANNLANVNSTGYKTERAEFKSLLYQTLQTRTTTANGANKPIAAQVGLGVRNSSIESVFTQGNVTETHDSTDFCIEGEGFFGLLGPDGERYYTRNGKFNFSVSPNGGMTLTSDDGSAVIDSNGNPITLGPQYQMDRVSVAIDGRIMYKDEANNPQPIGIQIGLYQFNNPAGLTKTAATRYQESDASGPVINEQALNVNQRSVVHQGFLEGSNVQVADEMVNLIVAQRAYEMNSKAIQASDEMMGQANNLRR